METKTWLERARRRTHVQVTGASCRWFQRHLFGWLAVLLWLLHDWGIIDIPECTSCFAVTRWWSSRTLNPRAARHRVGARQTYKPRHSSDYDAHAQAIAAVLQHEREADPVFWQGA